MAIKWYYFFLLFVGFVEFSIPQTSLWQNRNIYGKFLEVGDIIQIHIDEAFQIDIDSEWDTKKDFSFRLIPDNNYFSFLQETDIQKNNNQDVQSKIQIKDNIQFTVSGAITNILDNQYSVFAQKNITIDDKSFAIQLEGIFSIKDLKNHAISSKYIANLNLVVQAEPTVDRSSNVTLQYNELEEQNRTTNLPSQPPQISDEDKNTVILEYLREILSILNN